MFKVDGKLERELALPGIGSAGGFGGKNKDKDLFYSYTSFTSPSTIIGSFQALQHRAADLNHVGIQP